MNSPVRHQLKARRVQFDFDNTPLHWLKDDPFSTHIINGIHLLLPAGELWFCRVYNQALPLVSDDQLRADVEGFIRQEAVHSRAHSKAQLYLERHGLSVNDYVQRIEWLFGTFLGEAPFGLKFLQRKAIQKQWLVLRVGLIAAIEHFTGVLGQSRMSEGRAFRLLKKRRIRVPCSVQWSNFREEGEPRPVGKTLAGRG